MKFSTLKIFHGNLWPMKIKHKKHHIIILSQKHSKCKKEWPRTKRTCWKRFEIKMGSQGFLLLTGLKKLIIMTSLQNMVILGAQGLLMLMGSKSLIKMTRPQNIWMKEQCFVAWSLFCTWMFLILLLFWKYVSIYDWLNKFYSRKNIPGHMEKLVLPV